MKLDAFQCPICLSTHLKVDGDKYICLSCGNVYTKRQADSQMFIDLRIANSKRQFAEFSQAREMYREIILKYPEEDLSLAYWGLLLCDQSVLIETDNNNQVMPTLYRVKEESIFASLAYKRFIDYVSRISPEKMEIYQERINAINLAKEKAIIISKNRNPYDIFICFKKTELDSDIVTNEYDLANEIYNNLSSQYRVFYSEKSLRGLQVREYEPNIFYGLHTAKVMLLICSKREFLESHWMKNEWLRFLQINKNKKYSNQCIIPIFIDGFTPDDLPDELSHLQGLKYGISLMGDIEREISAIISPENIEAEQNKEIARLAFNQKKIIEQLTSKETENIVDRLNNTKRSSLDVEAELISLFKLIKVNIEDLENYDDALELVLKAQHLDAEYYLVWYYKLLIDYKVKDMKELIKQSDYKNNINYRLLIKYSKDNDARAFVQSIEDTRREYLYDQAEKINQLLDKLDINPRPTEEDINDIKILFESIDKDAKVYIKDIKDRIPVALKKIKENKVSDFNTLLKVVNNKEFPKADDMEKIKNSYAKLTDDERTKVDNYREVVINANKKMILGKVYTLQKSLEELDANPNPTGEEIKDIEKRYRHLDDDLKEKVINFNAIMARAYNKKYIQDAKHLDELLQKLPNMKKELNVEIYNKLLNRYESLPRKYQNLVINAKNLDDYFIRLAKAGLVEVEELEEYEEENVQKKEISKQKKKLWRWSKN